MFHMTQEIYFKARELSQLLSESAEFKAMRQAEDDGEKDPALSACVAAYLEKRQQLEKETAKDEKDFNQIGALTRELDEIDQQMQKIPAYQTLQKARGDFSAMMQAISDILQSVMYPENNGCTGDCSNCSGCH